MLLLNRSCSYQSHTCSFRTDFGPQVLDHRVQYRDLGADDHQQEVTAQFEALYHTLETYRPTQPSFFSSLFAGPSSKRWSRSSPASSAPRGVYLWGTVGGGKTMLMDLFYDTLGGLSGDIRARRVHYYDFMQVPVFLLQLFPDHTDPGRSQTDA